MNDKLKTIKKELKTKLESELLELKEEISKISIPNKNSIYKNSAKETNTQSGTLDNAEQASELINIHNNNAILEILNEREKSVKKALERLKNNKFEKCEVCGETIEKKRLLVNTSATTCTKHM